MVIFLGLNVSDLDAIQENVVTTMLAAAAGQLTDRQLGDWVRAHLVKLA